MNSIPTINACSITQANEHQLDGTLLELLTLIREHDTSTLRLLIGSDDEGLEGEIMFVWLENPHNLRFRNRLTVYYWLRRVPNNWLLAGFLDADQFLTWMSLTQEAPAFQHALQNEGEEVSEIAVAIRLLLLEQNGKNQATKLSFQKDRSGVYNWMAASIATRLAQKVSRHRPSRRQQLAPA